MFTSLCDKIIEKGIIFLIIFTPFAFGTVHAWSTTIMELTVLSLTLIWMIKLIVKFQLVKTPLNLPLIIFLFLIVFQIIPLPNSIIKILSPNTHTLYKTYSEYLIWSSLSIYTYATKIEIFKFLTYICMFFLVLNNIKGKRQIEHITVTIIIVAFLIATLGLIQSISDKNVWFSQFTKAGCTFGPYVSKNHFAGYLEMAIPLSIGLLITYLKHFPQKKNWRKLMEKESQLAKFILLAFVIVVMVVSIFFSLSRAGVISFLLSMVILLDLFFIRKKKKSLKTLIILFTICSIFLIWLGIDPIITRFSALSVPYKSMTRSKIWEDSYQIIKDFPILGTGLGTYQYIFPKYKNKMDTGLVEYAHNDYLEYLSDIGVIGTLLFFGSIIYFLIKSLKLWRERNYPYVVGLSLGGIIGIISILFHSVVDFNLHIPANALLFFIILALINNILHLKHKEEIVIAKNYSFNPKIKFILPIFFIVILLLMGKISKIHVAEQYFKKVASNNLTSSRHILHKAIKLAPDNAEYHYYLGKSYEEIGLKDKSIDFLKLAKRKYQQAIKLEPTNAWYHLSLGWIYAQLGIDHLAVKEINLASELDPKNPYIAEYITNWITLDPLNP